MIRCTIRQYMMYVVNYIHYIVHKMHYTVYDMHYIMNVPYILYNVHCTHSAVHHCIVYKMKAVSTTEI